MRSPVSSSTRRSSTRGARTSISCSRHQRPWLGVSVAHDQATTVFVDVVDQARDVAVDLGFEGRGHICLGTLGHQLVQPLDSSALVGSSTCTL